MASQSTAAVFLDASGVLSRQLSGRGSQILNATAAHFHSDAFKMKLHGSVGRLFLLSRSWTI